MNREFIPYEQALALKELGFDEPCFTIFLREEFRGHIGLMTEGFPINSETNNIDIVSAPLYLQCFRWFREKYNLLGNVYSNASGWLWEIHNNIGGTHRFGSELSGDCEESGMFTSFEKAELECLKKLIEIVKNKK